MTEADRFSRARGLFEKAHLDDPRVIVVKNESRPFALAYHQTLERWVTELDSEASTALRLAALCQHIHRHLVPRQDFPMDLIGYKRWRSTLAQRHAAEARRILEGVDYDSQTVDRVCDLLVKKGLKRDAEVALFEDAICMTFLELELSAFIEKHPQEKVIDVLRKTWGKMTEQGHAAALSFIQDAPLASRVLVERALAGG